MLSDTHIRNIKSLEKPKKYSDGGGLFLYVPTTGSKLWRMSYRFEGKSKLLSFGEYPTISLKLARTKRDEAKKLLAEGIDPSEQKKKIKAEKEKLILNSFENIAREWHENLTVNNSYAVRHRKLDTLQKHVFPHIGHIPITQIEASEILAIVKPLESKSIDYAHRVLQYCAMVFRYAIATNKAKYNVVINLKGALLPKRPVHRSAITEPIKVGKLLNEIDNYGGYFQVQCALKIMPYVFVRSSELRYARWEDIDFEEKLWRIPAEYMKMNTPHIVPLADQVIDILKSLKEYTGDGNFVFPSVKSNNKPISKSVMLHALRCMGYRKDELCVHGFRSIASTLLNELGFNRDWIERQLAHHERNAVRASYNYAQYLPSRKKMMQEWANYLESLKVKSLK